MRQKRFRQIARHAKPAAFAATIVAAGLATYAHALPATSASRANGKAAIGRATVTQAEQRAIQRQMRAAERLENLVDDSPAQRAKEAQLKRLSPAEAVAELSRSFPKVTDAPADPNAYLEGGTAKVLDYLGDTIARIRDASGKRRIVLSTRPLRARDDRGNLRPVDLALGSALDAFRPANAPFELAISKDPTNGFTIGPDPARAVKVTPLAVDDAAHEAGDDPEPAPPRKMDNSLVFAETHVDTDSVYVPMIDGVETFEQIRSREAPTEFSYRLDLAGGRAATWQGGILKITQAGESIVSVLPPQAVDSNGRPVPADMTLTGDVLTVSVDHTGANYAYPILLDPTWSSEYNWDEDDATGNAGWEFTEEPPSPYPWYYKGAQTSPPPGLFIEPTGGRVYQPETKGKGTLFAPGTTKIANVDWHHVNYLNYDEGRGDRQCMRLALYDPVGPRVMFDRCFAHPDGLYFNLVSTPDYGAVSILATAWMFTPECRTEPEPEEDCPRYIRSDTNTHLNIGAIDLTLTDDDFPYFSDLSGSLYAMRDTWSNPDGDKDVAGTVIDHGSGVRGFQLYATDFAGEHQATDQQGDCDNEDHHNFERGARICSENYPFDLPYPTGQDYLAEGKTTFRLAAQDYAGNDSDAGGTSASWDVYVDRTDPLVAAVGELRNMEDTWSNPHGIKDVTVGALDPEPAAGITPSGIDTYELKIYDDQGEEIGDQQPVDACPEPGPIDHPCPASPLPTTFHIDSDTLPEGKVTFVARAQDYVGNTSEEVTWQIYVDRTPPEVVAAGDLTELAGTWTAEDGQISIDIEGTDELSGVDKLELHAINEEGDKILAYTDACDTVQGEAGLDPCPKDEKATLTFDAGELPDGETEFVAKAIDFANNKTGDSFDASFDRTEPPAPKKVVIKGTSESSVKISWPPVEDAPSGSGIAGYEYKVWIEGRPATGWETTPRPAVNLGNLPPAARLKALARSIDHVKNASLAKKGKGKPVNENASAASKARMPKYFYPWTSSKNRHNWCDSVPPGSWPARPSECIYYTCNPGSHRIDPVNIVIYNDAGAVWSIWAAESEGIKAGMGGSKQCMDVPDDKLEQDTDLGSAHDWSSNRFHARVFQSNGDSTFTAMPSHKDIGVPHKGGYWRTARNYFLRPFRERGCTVHKRTAEGMTGKPTDGPVGKLGHKNDGDIYYVDKGTCS